MSELGKKGEGNGAEEREREKRASEKVKRERERCHKGDLVKEKWGRGKGRWICLLLG